MIQTVKLLYKFKELIYSASFFNIVSNSFTSSSSCVLSIVKKSIQVIFRFNLLSFQFNVLSFFLIL